MVDAKSCTPVLVAIPVTPRLAALVEPAAWDTSNALQLGEAMGEVRR